MNSFSLMTKAIQHIVLIVFILIIHLISGCGDVQTETSKSDPSNGDTTGNSSNNNTTTTTAIFGPLASSIISELESNLSSSISSRDGQSTFRENQKVSTNLTKDQISILVSSAKQSLADGNASESENIIEVIPLIIKGAQSKLSSIGNNSTETIKVIQVIVQSLTKSIKGRSSYFPKSLSKSGVDLHARGLKTISENSVSYLDEAGLKLCNGSDICSDPGCL